MFWPQCLLPDPQRPIATLSADPVMYHNLSAGKSWDNGVSLRLGVSNLLDEEPPVISPFLNVIANSAFYPQYDFYGRRLWLNVTYSTD